LFQEDLKYVRGSSGHNGNGGGNYEMLRGGGNYPPQYMGQHRYADFRHIVTSYLSIYRIP
jgi:hypothetical protein